MSEPTPPQGTDRRVIPQRSTTWAAKLADAMYAAKLTPNRVSIGSVLFALIGAVGLIASGLVSSDGARAAWLVVTACCIPLRLLFNMLDGCWRSKKECTLPPAIYSMRYPIVSPISCYWPPPVTPPQAFGWPVVSIGAWL